MLNSQRRAGGGRVSAVGKLLAVSVGAGLLVAAVAVPLFGAAGVVTRNAANTFNTLKVPSLGQIPSRSEILDADGNLIAYYYPRNLYRVPVAYNQIAPVMRNAIVAIEDSRFYAHGAFDLRGTLRALANDLSTSANPQGGSTLAQEYVKNALILTATTKQQQDDASEDTVARKIRELRMAAVVEHEMTKQELLAAYLNAAYYNHSAYGIQVAAERYFSTSAADLTLPEAALLAGLVRNPSQYDPVAFPDQAIDRRNTVLTRMAQVGYITPAQAAAAEKLPLGLKMSTLPLQSGCLSQSAASDAFFCDYVLAVIRTNPAFAAAKQMLNTVGGLKIYTTLNPQDQKAANDAVNWVAPANSGFLQPGPERGHRGADPAGHRQDPRDRGRPAVRKRAGTDHGQLRRRDPVRRQHRGRPDGLVEQDLHPDHRAQAGDTVRLQHERGEPEHGRPVHQLPGRHRARLPVPQRGGSQPQAADLHALQRDHAVDQHLLRPAGAEGRAVQRGQDRGQHGHDASSTAATCSSRTGPSTRNPPTTTRRSHSARCPSRR